MILILTVVVFTTFALAHLWIVCLTNAAIEDARDAVKEAQDAIEAAHKSLVNNQEDE